MKKSHIWVLEYLGVRGEWRISLTRPCAFTTKKLALAKKHELSQGIPVMYRVVKYARVGR
jgi:hypothetical protein